MTLKRASRLAAFLLIAGLLAWAVYLFTVGVRWVGYFETVPGQAGLQEQITYRPYLPALYSVAALVVVALGLLRDEWLPWRGRAWDFT
jgi:hypothetical protein